MICDTKLKCTKKKLQSPKILRELFHESSLLCGEWVGDYCRMCLRWVAGSRDRGGLRYHCDSVHVFSLMIRTRGSQVLESGTLRHFSGTRYEEKTHVQEIHGYTKTQSEFSLVLPHI